MSVHTMSSLSMKRVVITLAMIIAIPFAARLLNTVVMQDDISLMYAFTACACLLLVYDWNLFGIHYNRAKNAPMDTILYTVIGFLLLVAWHMTGYRFLQPSIVLPATRSLIAYGYARPAMLIGYSFSQAVVINIGFKALTDHLDVRSREIQAILISGLLFGLFYTLLFTPFSLALLSRTYLFNLVQTCILSYLYNQSHSFIPGLIGLTVLYALLMATPLL